MHAIAVNDHNTIFYTANVANVPGVGITLVLIPREWNDRLPE